MKTQTWFTVGVLLAFGVGCSGAEKASEPAEKTRGHGTFLVLGQPIEAEYEVRGDVWTIFDDIGIDPETELLFEHEPGQVSELALKEGKYLKSNLWPNAVIPYRLSKNVDNPGTVKTAMKEWEQKTKIQFVVRTNQKAFLDIYEYDAPGDDDDYCMAQAGYTGGVRWLRLRPGGYCNKGVITHELGHSVGFRHEHQRTDRGKYVKLNMNCTSKPTAYAMLHSPEVFQFGSYDIHSTMHYKSSSLNSCSSTSAILAKDGSWLGHNWETLSAGDVAATAKMYGPKVDDQDSDGVTDSKDNCKSESNESQLDTDGDGKGDACDVDDDGDGIDDGPDNCSKKSNSSQLDTDKDGTGDACDSDDDGDKLVDSKDNCEKKSNPSQLDTDKDGDGNACDDDDDGDGVPDATDNCPLVSNANQADTDQDGTGNVCSDDNDGDGIVDGDDNCVNDANPEQADADHDGKGDACETDTDSDGDGVVNADDNCPELSNADQKDENQDDIGDACQADGDEDGIPDATDNCPTVPNPDQYDSNGAGVGDACPDSDGDGLHDGVDNCPDDANADQADGDQDGIGDACDDELDTPPDFPDYVPPDTKAAPLEETSSCQLVRSRGNGSSLALGFLALALGLGTRLIFRSRVRASGGLRPRLGRWRGAPGIRRAGRFHRDPPRTSGEPGRCR